MGENASRVTALAPRVSALVRRSGGELSPASPEARSRRRGGLGWTRRSHAAVYIRPEPPPRVGRRSKRSLPAGWGAAALRCYRENGGLHLASPGPVYLSIRV